MPIYEYRCQSCAHQFEALLFAGDPDPEKCPKCSGKAILKLISSGSCRPQGIPKGSGGFKVPACRQNAGG